MEPCGRHQDCRDARCDHPDRLRNNSDIERAGDVGTSNGRVDPTSVELRHHSRASQYVDDEFLDAHHHHEYRQRNDDAA